MSFDLEDHFVTTDGDKTFRLIEDENGDTYWGYGHRDSDEFIGQINEWLTHACGCGTDDLVALSEPVDHLWARYESGDDERFTLVDPSGTGADADVFPVTRFIL